MGCVSSTFSNPPLPYKPFATVTYQKTSALAALVLMYCFKSSPHVALHEALPADYAEFALSVLKILEEFSSSSPVVRIYHKIALILCGKLTQ